MPRVDWLQEAIEETRAAHRWYRERSERAAAGLLAELDRGVEAVAATPERFPLHLHGTRRFLLDRYPYLLVYRVEPDASVLVIAFQHGRQRPGYWLERA